MQQFWRVHDDGDIKNIGLKEREKITTGAFNMREGKLTAFEMNYRNSRYPDLLRTLTRWGATEIEFGHSRERSPWALKNHEDGVDGVSFIFARERFSVYCWHELEDPEDLWHNEDEGETDVYETRMTGRAGVVIQKCNVAVNIMSSRLIIGDFGALLGIDDKNADYTEDVKRALFRIILLINIHYFVDQHQWSKIAYDIQAQTRRERPYSEYLNYVEVVKMFRYVKVGKQLLMDSSATNRRDIERPDFLLISDEENNEILRIARQYERETIANQAAGVIDEGRFFGAWELVFRT